jgi:predicted RNA-binding Zn ribbon-like protein
LIVLLHCHSSQREAASFARISAAAMAQRWILDYVIEGAVGEELSVALSLVNTIRMSRDGEVDLLADPVAHTQWFIDRSLTRRRLPVGTDEIARVAELRTAVRGLFTAVVDGRRPPRSVLSAINTVSRLNAVSPTLAWTADGPRRSYTAGSGNGIDAILATVAADAIEVVTGESGARLRRCQAPGCVGLFLLNHARRVWCSTMCGDRVRAARHYRTARRESNRTGWSAAKYIAAQG